MQPWWICVFSQDSAGTFFLLGEFANNYTIKPLKKHSRTYIKLFDTKVNQWWEHKDQPLFTALQIPWYKAVIYFIRVIKKAAWCKWLLIDLCVWMHAYEHYKFELFFELLTGCED